MTIGRPPLSEEAAQQSAERRFWQRVEQTANCWQWTGYRGADGYGRVSLRTHKMLAHRFSYELARGSIPIGLTLDHLCRNRACVNPAHLEPVTLAVNVLRGESEPAGNRRLTHCKRGHSLDDPANVYRRKDRSGRQCRACARIRKAALA